MKILQVITKANWGGAQVYVHDLLQASALFNAESVLVYGTSGALLEKISPIPTIHISSLERNITLFGDIKTFFSLYRLFRKERPDVVHLHSSKAAVIGSIAARMARVPRIIFTAHGWPYNESRPWWQRIIFICFAWLAVQMSHTTIAVSHTVRVQAPLFFTNHKIQTIHNGVESFSLYGKENARSALGLKLPKDAFIFGSIGELHKSKGFDILLQSFARIHKKHPHTHLIIMGEGEERTHLEAIIAKEKLAACVTLCGHVDNAKEFLRAYNVFVLPSRTEALGYVLLEAGIAHVPVIGTRVGGIPEIIEHKHTGLLVTKGDMRELTLAMEYSLSHKQELDEYSKNLATKVATEYKKEDMLKAIYALYKK